MDTLTELSMLIAQRQAKRDEIQQQLTKIDKEIKAIRITMRLRVKPSRDAKKEEK